MNKSQIDEIILVGGSTHIPRIQSIIKEFFNGKEPKKNINPDEAAAYGAAIQAVIMSDNTNEKIEKPIMNNIIPLSIGIETEYGIMNVLIPRNSTIPCQKSKIFYFRGFIQTSVLIKVFEGERLFIKDNHYLDEFILDGIFPGSKLQPIIEITLYIDENLVLYVTAVEKNIRGKNDKIIINYNKKRLSKDDIEKHIKEAEKFKDEDNKDKQRIEAKYTLVNYCYKILREVKDIKIESQFSKNEREQIKTKVNGVLKWIQDNNAASKEEYDIKEKEIEDLVIPIMKNIYSQLEIGQEKMFIFPKKWSIESNGLFLPEGVNDSSDYTGKYKNNLEQGNSQSLSYDIITEYIKQKRRKNKEFKKNLDEIIDIANENYYEINDFIQRNKNIINIKDIQYGFELFKKSEKILNNILSICELNEFNLIEQYKKYQSEIDPMIKREKNYITLKSKLYVELAEIKKKKSETQKEEEQKIKLKLIKMEELNILCENESKKEKKIIKSKEICRKENEVNDLQEDLDNLTKELMEIKREELKLSNQINGLQNQIIKIHENNPLNKLEKYDLKLVLYINKIAILNRLINGASLKMLDHFKKQKNYK